MSSMLEKLARLTIVRDDEILFSVVEVKFFLLLRESDFDFFADYLQFISNLAV